MSGLGILGGTFNPPHNGHLASAHYAHRQLGLERVLLMPVSSPPHKTAGEDPGAEHRVAMCRLAADGDETLARLHARGRTRGAVVHGRYPAGHTCQ